jgi:hypothetical protein
MVLVEYYNWDKIRSVPDDACAFQRPKFSNGVVTLGWKNNTPENLTLARNISREFASIIADGQEEYLSKAEPGYGNYGTFRGFFFLLQVTSTRSSLTC